MPIADPEEITKRLDLCFTQIYPQSADYKGPMGFVMRAKQMAQRLYRVGDEIVRINVTVADVPPSAL